MAVRSKIACSSPARSGLIFSAIFSHKFECQFVCTSDNNRSANASQVPRSRTWHSRQRKSADRPCCQTVVEVWQSSQSVQAVLRRPVETAAQSRRLCAYDSYVFSFERLRIRGFGGTHHPDSARVRTHKRRSARKRARSPTAISRNRGTNVLKSPRSTRPSKAWIYFDPAGMSAEHTCFKADCGLFFVLD